MTSWIKQKWGSRNDHGGATVWTLASVPILLGLAAFGMTGIAHLAALNEVRDLADNAARAGAQQVDLDSLRSTGEPALLSGDAAAAAANFVAATGRPATVQTSVTGDVITVTVSMQTVSFGMFPARTVSVTQSANAVDGVTVPDG